MAEAEKQFLHDHGRCIWKLLRMQSHPESKKEQGIVNNIRIPHLYTKLEMTKTCMLYHFKQEAWLTASTFGTDHKVSVLFFCVVHYVLSWFQQRWDATQLCIQLFSWRKTKQNYAAPKIKMRWSCTQRLLYSVMGHLLTCVLSIQSSFTITVLCRVPHRRRQGRRVEI